MASLLDMFGNISGAEYAQRFQDIENRRKREIMDREEQAQSLQTRQALGELAEIMGQVDLSSPEKVRQAYSDLIRIAGEENWPEELRREAFRMFNDMSIRQERARPVRETAPERQLTITEALGESLTNSFIANPGMTMQEVKNLLNTGKIMSADGSEIDYSTLGPDVLATIIRNSAMRAGLGEGAISQIFTTPEPIRQEPERGGLRSLFGRPDETYKPAGGRLGSLFGGNRDFGMSGGFRPTLVNPRAVEMRYGYQPEDVLGGGVSMPKFTVNEKRPTEQSEKGYNFQKREKEVKEPMSIIREKETGTKGSLRNNFKDRQEKDIEDLWRPTSRVNNFYMK